MPIDTPASIGRARRAEHLAQRLAWPAARRDPTRPSRARPSPSGGRGPGVQARGQVRGGVERSAEHGRDQILLEHVPGGCRGLGAVERIRVGDALAPADGAARRPRTSTRIASRADIRPKLVSNGRTSGIRRTVSPTAAMRIAVWYLFPAWTFATSPSKGRRDSGRPCWPNGSPRGWTRPSSWTSAANPFLADFYAGRGGAAFQTQLFFTLARHRQLQRLRQGDLFAQTTICDFVFERDRIYAFTNLDDNELYIYQRLFDLVSRDLPLPDLVVYLQAPVDLLEAPAARARQARGRRQRRCRARTTWPNSARPTTTSSFTTPPRRCSSSKRPTSIWAGATRRSTICCARSARWARARSTTCRAGDGSDRSTGPSRSCRSADVPETRSEPSDLTDP